MSLSKTTIVCAVGMIFCSGVWVGAKLCEAHEAKIKLEAEERIAKQEEESYEVYRKQQEALAEALAQRDKALRSVADLRATADRLRRQADARAAAEAASDPGDGRGERLGNCLRLLGEGAELVAEGAGLSVRVSADKDALGAAAGTANLQQ